MVNELTAIVHLLREVDEEEWLKVFQHFLDISRYDEDNVKNKIRQVYGGMGSFNDLILYRGGMPCKEENERLDDLRKQLFKMIH